MRGVVGAGLRKHTVQTRKKAQRDSAFSPPWIDQIVQVEKSAAPRRTIPKQGIQQQWREARTARVEALRIQVRAGTYQVDSHVLADLLLTKGNHTFLKKLE